MKTYIILFSVLFLVGCGANYNNGTSYISISSSGDAACDALLSDMAWCIAKDVGDPNAQQNYFDAMRQALSSGTVLNNSIAVNYFTLEAGDDMYDSFNKVLQDNNVVYHASTLAIDNACEGL